MATNTLSRSERIRRAEKRIEAVIAELHGDYDLSPLNSFFGVDGEIRFLNHFGDTLDFEGADFGVSTNGVKTSILVSEKEREKDRSDLGQEVVRVFERKPISPHGDHCYLVVSGGRDMIRMPPSPICAHSVPDQDYMLAEHSTRTESDFLLLWTNRRGPAFIRSDVAKPFGYHYMNMCLERFSEIQLTLGRQPGAPYEKRKLFDCSDEGMELWSVGDKDKKDVICDGKLIKDRHIAKIILYINLEKCFVKDQDYVVLQKKDK